MHGFFPISSPNYKKVFETFKTVSHGSSLGSSESETPGVIPPRLSSGGLPGLPLRLPPGPGDSFDASSVNSDVEEDITSAFR